MEYWSWLVMAMFGVAISFTGIGRFVADAQNSDYTDILVLLVAAAIDIFTAINAQVLDFIKSDGTVAPYTGMGWVTYPFYAMFLLCAGFVLIAVIVVFRRLRINRLYPPMGYRG